MKRRLNNMHNQLNLRNNLLFSSITTLSLVMLSENSIASEGRIQAATQQNVPLQNVDNPGKVNNFVNVDDTYHLLRNILEYISNLVNLILYKLITNFVNKNIN